MITLLRRRAMIASGGGSPTPPTPPVGNTPYIRGGADGSYIDTGITADDTVKVIIWARNYNPNSGFLFGSREGATQNAFVIAANSGAESGGIRLGYSQSNSTLAGDQFANLSRYHKYEYYQGVLKVDDVTVASASGSSFSSQLNIHLFGANDAGDHSSMALPADICACKIYKNDVLVRDYTPVGSPAAGLYDAVSQTLFTNAGGIGSFTYGAFNNNAYTPLEFIECDGNQYFDTGVSGGYSTPVTAKFRYTTNTSNVALFGYRGSSDWFEFCINYGSTVKTYFRLASDSTWRNMSSSSSSNFVGIDIVFRKDDINKAALYKNGSALGSSVSPTSSTSYVSSDTLFIGALNRGDTTSQPFTGRIYYLGIGSSRSFVPANVNGVAGMYDTYNDVFYSSDSGAPFIGGSTI